MVVFFRLWWFQNMNDNYKEIIIRPVEQDGNSKKIRVLPNEDKTLFDMVVKILEKRGF